MIAGRPASPEAWRSASYSLERGERRVGRLQQAERAGQPGHEARAQQRRLTRSRRSDQDQRQVRRLVRHGGQQVRDILAAEKPLRVLRESGSFDGTRFFRLNNVTQLELRVWSEDSQSRARLHLPSVRSQSGRPQRLAPVGNALAAAEHSVRSADPTATVS